MTLSELYDFAAKKHIPIECCQTSLFQTLSVCLDNGECFVGVNPYTLDSNADELVKLAHEIGHCVTGSFYNRHSKLDIRQKHENVADGWAIKKLIPKDELLKAIFDGITEPWELAEHFGVTLEFMYKTMERYETDEAFVATVAPLRQASF